MKMHHNRSAWLAWTLCGMITLVVLVTFVFDLANRSSGASMVVFADEVVWALLPIMFAILAALVLSRQPNNMIGWLLLIPALGLAIPTESYIKGFLVAPAAPPVLLLLALWLNGWGWLLFIFPLLFIVLLFPTGQPLSPRWHWLIVLGLGMSLFLIFFTTFSTTLESGNGAWVVPNPLGFLPSSFFPIVAWIIGLVFMVVLCVASLFIRYRRASALERQQIKWLLYACGVFLVVYLTGIRISDLSGIVNDLWNVLFGLSVLAIPVAITVAILRYRLWDIDVLIRRTLTYSLLSLLLGLSYFGGVTLLQSLVQAVSGQRSPISIVISTLVIAALFNPLRRRVQNFIDRRFYRRKYDAEKALAEFAATARSETDLGKLTNSVLNTVQATLQPESAAVWVKPDSRGEARHQRENPA